MGSAVGRAKRRAKRRKELEHYFEGEKRQKKGGYLFMFQAKGRDPGEKGILIKKERRC